MSELNNSINDKIQENKTEGTINLSDYISNIEDVYTIKYAITKQIPITKEESSQIDYYISLFVVDPKNKLIKEITSLFVDYLEHKLPLIAYCCLLYNSAKSEKNCNYALKVITENNNIPTIIQNAFKKMQDELIETFSDVNIL